MHAMKIPVKLTLFTMTAVIAIMIHVVNQHANLLFATYRQAAAVGISLLLRSFFATISLVNENRQKLPEQWLQQPLGGPGF